MSKRTKLAPIFGAKKAKRDAGTPVVEEVVDNAEKIWKIISWNVAGLRGLAKKENHKLFNSDPADIIFLGEVKCKEWPPELESDFKDYHKHLEISKEKNGGYAGVALLSKVKPLKVTKGIDNELFNNEGRLIVAEYPNFFFVGSYVPNSGRGLVNLDKREKWESLMLEKMKILDAQKPVIYGGDLNVAHNEIDLANPESNRNKTAGFTDQERGWFTDFLAAGFKDSYRELNPEKKEYSYWSYMGNARSRNVGWRLDYYVVSSRIMENVITSEIRTTVMGSDHCPIYLEIKI